MTSDVLEHRLQHQSGQGIPCYWSLVACNPVQPASWRCWHCIAVEWASTMRPPARLKSPSIKCPRPGRASELEDFGCDLAWRGMGSAKRHCPRVTAWNVSQKEHHTGSVVARVTKDCPSGCAPGSCRWKVDYWCAKKDHPCQKQHHHWHLECKNTERCGKTRRTPTWDEKIWLEHTRTLSVTIAQDWREKHTGRSPTILEWPRQHTRARCWAPCLQEHCELRHRLLPNLK